jgi:hypothetical protein
MGWFGLTSDSKPESDKATQDHNEGQEAGANASAFDQFLHYSGGVALHSDEYNAGYVNGVNNQSKS